MIGYVYLTTNLINGRMYVGKHHSTTYDNKYYGSGKILLQAIELYGKDNFSNIILYEANTIDELNDNEKRLIAEYRRLYGDLMYNIADGGDGGNTLSGKSDEEKAEFVEKMTKINRERCNTEDFKNKLSVATKKRYESVEERQKQSIKIRKAWSDEKLRKEQGERIKQQYADGKRSKDYSYAFKPCVFELNGERKEFKSLKDLMQFLDDTYDYRPGRYKLKQVMQDAKNGIPFTHCHKNRYKHIIGMFIYYK